MNKLGRTSMSYIKEVVHEKLRPTTNKVSEKSLTKIFPTGLHVYRENLNLKNTTRKQ